MTISYSDKLREEYTRIDTATKNGTMAIAERIAAIEGAVDVYSLAHADAYQRAGDKALALGKSPGTVPINFKDAGLLEKLTDLIIHEDLSWSHPDKMTLINYPIMSDRQAETRGRKQTLISEMSFGRDAVVGSKTVCYEDESGATRMHKKKIYDYPR